MDGVLDHVPGVHGLLQATGNALHGGTAAWEKRQTLRFKSIHSFTNEHKKTNATTMMMTDIFTKTERLYTNVEYNDVCGDQATS